VGRRGVGLVALVLLLGVPAAARADDVPDPVRKEYADAKALLARGDPKSVEAAFEGVRRIQDRASASVDYWDLFVRVWRAQKRPEESLWKEVTGPREAAMPGSAVFDLLRARLEDDPDKRRAHLEAAVAREPKSVPARLALARQQRAEGNDGDAEDTVEAALEVEPGCEQALVMKGDLMLEGGRARSAMEFAREALATRDLPGLHALLARALERLAENEPRLREEAAKEAEKAVAMRPDAEAVATLAALLDAHGETARAVGLLKTHFERTREPLLGGILGAMAFRQGDYDAAVKALGAATAPDAKSAKALALAHARRGRAKEAAAALARVLALDPGATEFACGIDLLLGDTAALRARLAGEEDDASRPWLLRAFGWEGNGGEILKRAHESVRSGTREGEEDLLLLLEARAFTRLGAGGGAARRRLLQARWKAAGDGVPEVEVPTEEPPVKANTHGFMERHVSYRRSVCGDWFRPSDADVSITLGPGGFGMAVGVTGFSPCAREKEREFRFTVPGGDGGFERRDAEWEEASKAFAEGCSALVTEAGDKAYAAFSRALAKEPGWGRAKLLRAAAGILGNAADATTSAREALEAGRALVDDFEGRRLAALLATIAGVDPARDLEDFARREEAFAGRRIADL
jgi:tetratricopeptide (TPR) repeat protein